MADNSFSHSSNITAQMAKSRARSFVDVIELIVVPALNVDVVDCIESIDDGSEELPAVSFSWILLFDDEPINHVPLLVLFCLG